MTILEIASQAFAAKLDEGVDTAIAAAVSPLAGEIDALQDRVAALDAVRHLMFSEETPLV